MGIIVQNVISPKKIAFYVNTFLVGGIETSMLEYLRSLDSNKYDITLVIGYCMFELEAMIIEVPKHIKIIYIIKSKFLVNNWYQKKSGKYSLWSKISDNLFISFLRRTYYKKKLIKVIAEFEIVVDYALGLTKFIDIIYSRTIAFFHFSLKNYYTKNPRAIAYLQKRLTYYVKIVVLNKHMHEESIELFPDLKDKFVLIYNQFDFKRIEKLANYDINLLNGLSDNYIVSVGRLEENQKDFTSLIKAYQLIKNNFKRIEKLIIVGSGKDELKIKNLINDLDLNNDVFLIGYQSNPFPWVKKSKLFVLSSKFEGLPTVLIEAMILQKPVIATDCPNGPREILMDGICGKLVAVGNIEKLANIIQEVLSSQDIYDKLIINANAHLNRFDITKNIYLLEQILT